MRPEHEIKLRVRYEETDTMRVVYYAKYFVWFEVGRMELFRHLGLEYRRWEERGLRIPVVEAKATYHASAKFDDEVLVKTRVAKVGNTSLRFENEVYRLPSMTLLCDGYTVHVLVNSRGKPVEFPRAIAKKLNPS